MGVLYSSHVCCVVSMHSSGVARGSSVAAELCGSVQ